MSKANKNEIVDMQTGEILSPKLNEVITHVSIRPNGSKRIQQDFSNCPTMAEQHTAHLTNINYLIERYKPDELAAYLAARNQHRQEIRGHDFAAEPSMQDAKNVIYQSKQEFEKLPEETKSHFRNHLEFLKFIDNPANAEKMIKLGILTPRQIEKIQIPEKDAAVSPTPTTKHEEETAKK